MGELGRAPRNTIVAQLRESCIRFGCVGIAQGTPRQGLVIHIDFVGAG